jgi:hypothetical protein
MPVNPETFVAGRYDVRLCNHNHVGVCNVALDSAGLLVLTRDGDELGRVGPSAVFSLVKPPETRVTPEAWRFENGNGCPPRPGWSWNGEVFTHESGATLTHTGSWTVQGARGCSAMGEDAFIYVEQMIAGFASTLTLEQLADTVAAFSPMGVAILLRGAVTGHLTAIREFVASGERPSLEDPGQSSVVCALVGDDLPF